MTMKPMLADHYVEEQLVFPRLDSPKVDGFRCFNDGGNALTRSRKPQPNLAVRSALSDNFFHGLDGELVAGDITDPQVFQKSSGDLRRAGGAPDWSWHLFDDFTDPRAPFEYRLAGLDERAKIANERIGEERVFVLKHELVKSIEEFDEHEARCVGLGFEGKMTRKADGPYKFGRSTVKEGYLLKVKRFSHDEAQIIGGVELMHNENESFVNELGRSSRSSHKENLIESGMLGAYIVRNPNKWQSDFRVSCGSMSHEDRKAALSSLSDDIGRLVRFKHFSHGAKDVPRHAIFDGYREQWDMGE